MDYGVYTSELLEIAQTKFWTLCFYCNEDKTNIGVKLYKGLDNNKNLTAVCERNMKDNKTLYAYEIPSGERFTNDYDGILNLIGSSYNYDTTGLKKIDDIIISEKITMPSVSEEGIINCLKLWRKGTFYSYSTNGIQFQLITNKIEYIFSIYSENCNIYCGASVNIPCENGMLGGNQYFRLRNFADNSRPFCKFYCNLGGDIEIPQTTNIVCESGKCTNVAQGIYWPVKRYTDDEIILDGCGGDEYIYQRNQMKSEYFL